MSYPFSYLFSHGNSQIGKTNPKTHQYDNHGADAQEEGGAKRQNHHSIVSGISLFYIRWTPDSRLHP